MTRHGAVRWVVGCSLVLLGTVAVSAIARAAEPAAVGAAQRIAQLQADVQAAEDIRAIKRLQRTYGYFLDKGMWTDLAEYFTDDAVANYPAGIYVGKESLREHLYRNVGNVPMGQVGLGDNRLYNHMSVQPVVHLDAGGQTASGRWRAIAMFGSMGGGATWAEGIYQMRYRKENGVWKISGLDYHSGFGAPYGTGWAPPAPAPQAASGAAPRRRSLPHPPDRERPQDCEGFAPACVAPFHYANPGLPAGGRAWYFTEAPQPLDLPSRELDAAVAGLARRATQLADEQAIENLQRIYGFYYDRAQWDQMADLFSARGTLEFAQSGVYEGPQRIRAFLGTLGPHGGEPGWLNERIQLQIVVTVAPDGRTAHARSRELAMTGRHGQGGEWSEGIYENRFVKEDGRWKFANVHYFPTFQTDYDEGWGKNARPAAGIDANLPPDRPPTQRYEIYPRAHVPPFHYRNPVTNQPPTYPAVGAGGPDATLAAASLMPTGAAGAPRLEGRREAVLAEAERLVARYKDYQEIENLESAYGYYLDKNLWDPLSGLFARNASMELAMRGVYRGDIREFLWRIFGRGQQGPVGGRLGNHLQLQPVIHISPQGDRAAARVRMVQQMAMGPRASIGGAIYENEFVKEDGVWKISQLVAWNTLSAGYQGGWAKSAGRGMPGPSTDFPPDAPPTREVAMFPVVFNIPYHYANPVSGRRELPQLPSIAEQMQQFPIPPPAATAR